MFDGRRLICFRFLELRCAGVLCHPTREWKGPEKISSGSSQSHLALCASQTRGSPVCTGFPPPRRPLCEGHGHTGHLRRGPALAASDPQALLPATQVLAAAAEGLCLACSHVSGFWFHRPPGPAELSSPVCSELLSPAAFLYLNSSLSSSANDGTKANYRIRVVFRKYSIQSHFVRCILLSFFFSFFYLSSSSLHNSDTQNVLLSMKNACFLTHQFLEWCSFLSQLFKRASCYEI